MCNCAKRSENRSYIKKVGFEEILLSFLDPTSNEENTILYSYVAIVYLLPQETVSKLTLHEASLNKLVVFLKTASVSENCNCEHNFADLGTNVNMHGYEILMAIGALAHNKEARKLMTAQNVFIHLVNYGNRNNDPYNLELVLNAIHSLLAGDNIQAALKATGIEQLVETLTKSDTDGVRQEAIRVSEKIKALKIPPKRKLNSFSLIIN